MNNPIPPSAESPSLATTIPLSELDAYPPFLSRRSTHPGVLLADPLESLPLRSLDRFTVDHRSALVDALLSDLSRWNAPQSALDSARRLSDEHTYAVVTGQQAGMATGPLYTLHKAVGAVVAARELERLHPDHSFVPLFWIEGDDHDFDEARALTLLDRSSEPRTLRYDDGDTRPLHVGDRVVSAEALAAFVEEMRATLPETEFAEEAIALVTSAYSDGTLADGFARSLYALLGDTPLVVLSSRNAALKRLASDVFEREALHPERLYAALRARTEMLRSEELPTPIDPKEGALFITHDGVRRSLELDGDGYRIKGTDERLTKEEVATIARTSAEKLSPNVTLRPIVQDAILPTVVYLGGPSEVAYLDQLRDGYAAFGVAPSAVAPRPFVVLIEPKTRRVLSQSSVPLEALLATRFDAASYLVDATIVEEIERAEGESAEALRAAFAMLEELTKRIDPTLEKALGAAAANADKGVHDFAKRLRSALKKKEQVEVDRLESARALLVPGGKLQERSLNPLHYVAKYGTAKLRAALESIEMAPGMLQVVDVVSGV